MLTFVTPSRGAHMTELSAHSAPIDVPVASLLARPVTRRSILGLLSAVAVATAVRRTRSGEDAAADPAAWQQPPPYDGIVGLL